jgi:chaperonin GroES|tara:strand:- start:1305 stop:3524 length:2220 start_codon:yes stop_codon:yes gene_type:complete
MSIKQLQEFVGKVNIAEDLSKEMLLAIGQRVFRQYKEDFDTMTEWSEGVDNGIDLMRQEWHTKSTPWDGASNYKDPLLTQASIQFGDKASLELLRSKDLISAEIIGLDPSGEKKAKADRVTTYENYQINHDMGDWREDQERLFYHVPNVGTCFKKTVYDPVEDMTESHVIQYPDFVVNQATKSMETCRSFSQNMDFSDNEVNEKVQSKRWLERDIMRSKDEKRIDKEGDKGSNEAAKVDNAADNPDMYIEQQCFFDIDEDGYEEPYIITMHYASHEVVRIVARFDEQSIKVLLDDQVMTLPEALAARKEQELQEHGGLEGLSLLGLPDTLADTNPDELELLKIVPFQNITKYGFIPAPDGTFLDLGYVHLLGAITQTINATTNNLVDRATLNNLGGGFLAKEFRKDKGINRLRIGEWKQTEVPAEKFAKGMFPHPNQEPSPTLFQLNENSKIRAREFLSTVDVSSQINAQTAPTTALAIIQEAMVATSALFKRMLKSESNEFKILFRINQRTLDDKKYRRVLDDDQASVEADFNSMDMDLSPTANAEMSTKMQRIQTAQIELQQFPLVLQAGGNPLPILENYFEAIGSTITNQIFPAEGEMSDADKAQLEQMNQAQQQQQQIQQQQLQLQQMQVDILAREQDRMDQDSAAKRSKTAAETKKLGAQLVETLMNASKLGEEAETESLANAITKYTASVGMAMDNMLAMTTGQNQEIMQGMNQGMAGMEFDYDPATQALNVR